MYLRKKGIPNCVDYDRQQYTQCSQLSWVTSFLIMRTIARSHNLAAEWLPSSGISTGEEEVK
jgi:hypothetical protein